MAQGRLAELLLRWEELHEQGREVSAEELCRDCPECREELAQRIHALRVMGWVKEAARAADPQTAPPATTDGEEPRTAGRRHRPAKSTGPQTATPVPSPAGLLAALREHGILTPPQVQELSGAGGPAFADGLALAGELVGRGWLTAYQADQLLRGRAGELLVGPYRLLDRLGQGGMGQVFKARHVTMDRVVAVKVIPRKRVSDPAAVERFYREVRAVAQLSHPNIVTAFEVGRAGETHYLAMEYVDGIDLARLVQQSGPLPIPQACEYVRQAALGLQHAHERGLVHRDIKPGNLMVARPNPDGPPVIKILDFGLARFEREGSQAGRLTQLGWVVGTVDYIAPEQAGDARGADIRADIYGLGCSLFYLLTGDPPFPGDDVVEKIRARVQRDAPSVRRGRPEVSPALEQVLARMMARGPADRFQTPGEVAKALEPHTAEGRQSLSQPAQSSAAGEVEAEWPASSDAAAANSFDGLPTMPLPAERADEVTRRPPPVTGATSPSPAAGTLTRFFPRRRLALAVAAGLLLVVGLDPPRDPALEGLVAVIRGRARASHPWVAFSPDGHSVAFPGERCFEIWDMDRREPKRRMMLPADAPGPVAFGPNLLAAASGAPPNEILQVWDLGAGRPAERLRVGCRWGHSLPLAISPDGELLAVSTSEGRVRLWDLTAVPPKELPALEEPGGVNCGVTFSPDGTLLACAGTDGKARLWDRSGNDFTPQGHIEHPTPLEAVAFSPDGRTLATAGHATIIRLWDLKGGKFARPPVLEGHTERVTHVEYARDGKWLLSSGHDHHVILWDVGAARPAQKWKFPDLGTWAALAPDGRHLAVSHAGSIYIIRRRPAG
jgi:eukaryotic-like serine/threonine-protein kinase